MVISKKTEDIEYLRNCLAMKPKERFLKGIELSEWSILINKNIDFEIKNRLKNAYLLI